MSSQSYSERLVEFVLGLQCSDIPERTRQNAKLHILDVIGVILAATREDSGASAVKALNAVGGNKTSTVIGSRELQTMPGAALVNGVLSHTDDFDDTHGESIVHPSSTVLPANLAVGEDSHADGKTFLASCVGAYESIVRLGMVSPGNFHKIGFHPTGVCGIFGAALSAARLRGADADAARNAVGICGSQSAAILQFMNDGTNVKRLHPGWACYSGIMAELFAEAGMTGPREVFEGRYGFFDTHLQKDPCDHSKITAGLGDVWETDNIAYKPYPINHHLPAFLDCIRILRQQEGFAASDVVDVECILAPVQVGLICIPLEEKLAPSTPYAGKFSLFYPLALEFVKGHVTLADFTETAIRDREVLEFAKKIRYTESDDTGFPGGFPGWIRITLRNGRILERREKNNRGGPDNPLPDQEVIAKFRENASIVATDAQVRVIEGHVLNLEELKDVGILGASLRL